MSTLLLRLAGPMQSWGSDSKFEVRRTDGIPTKSAIVGLLAAALGRKRTENLDDLNALRFGVREDHPGEIRCDFQMVIAKTSGKKETSYLTRRYYIEDGIFLAGLESDDKSFLQALEEALKHPVFHLFLGRKSCPPTFPFVLGIRDLSLAEALQNEPWLLPDWRRKTANNMLRILMDCAKDDPVHGIKRDVPISFDSERREYRSRGIFQKYIFVENGSGDMESDQKETDFKLTEHDPMTELEGEYVSFESTT